MSNKKAKRENKLQRDSRTSRDKHKLIAIKLSLHQIYEVMPLLISSGLIKILKSITIEKDDST